MRKETHPWAKKCSAEAAPRLPVLKLSMKRTVFFSRGTMVPPAKRCVFLIMCFPDSCKFNHQTSENFCELSSGPDVTHAILSFLRIAEETKPLSVAARAPGYRCVVCCAVLRCVALCCLDCKKMHCMCMREKYARIKHAAGNVGGGHGTLEECTR